MTTGMSIMIGLGIGCILAGFWHAAVLGKLGTGILLCGAGVVALLCSPLIT